MGGKILPRVRNFIAIPLEGEPRTLLWEALNNWKKLQPTLRWEKRGNFHITLKFIGDSTEIELKTIDEIITDIFNDMKPFSVPLTKIGAFPDFNHPRVIWLGASFPEFFLDKINELDKALFNELGISFERRRFVPHITLARVKGDRLKNILLESFKEFNIVISEKKMKIAKVVHFKSELRPEGAIHTPIFTFYFSHPE